MKKVFLILFTLLTLQVSAHAIEKQEIVIDIEGMTCQFCAYGVQKKLNKISSIEDAKVDIETKKATIIVKQGEQVNLDEVKKAITDAGFVPVKVNNQADQ